MGACWTASDQMQLKNVSSILYVEGNACGLRVFFFHFHVYILMHRQLYMLMSRALRRYSSAADGDGDVMLYTGALVNMC